MKKVSLWFSMILFCSVQDCVEIFRRQGGDTINNFTSRSVTFGTIVAALILIAT